MRQLHLTLIWIFLPSMAAADFCADVADAADSWAGLAATVDDYAVHGGPSEVEAAELDRSIEEGLGITSAMVQALVGEGTGDEPGLGRSLGSSLQDLEQAETFDEIVDAMDAITDSLDTISEYCDQAAGAAAVQVIYDQPSDPGSAELAAALSQGGLYDQVAVDVMSGIALPATLPIRFTTCGEPNAFYNPEQGEVIMCYELFMLVRSMFDDPDSSVEEINDSVFGAGIFFLLHELGHALVHQLELPITGREEDAVDGLATLILVHAGGESDALAAADHFDTMARFLSQAGADMPFWDEHSLNEQRVYDIACLVFGSDPEKFAGMVAPDFLPAERAQRCPAEFEQKSRAWSQLLGPHFADG